MFKELLVERRIIHSSHMQKFLPSQLKQQERLI